MTRLRLAVLILICSLLATAAAFAQADPDPPSRVARLNYLKGDVSFQPGGVEDWTAADLNRPLTTADRLWTDREGRAELHIGSTALRLGEETSFTLANLDDRSVQIQLAQGTLNLRVRSLDDDQTIEVDTPNSSFILLHPGEYRVDVDNEGQTSWVTVRAGTGDLTGNGQRLTLRAGQQARLSGDNEEAEVNDAARRDDFDQWCLARNRSEDEVRSARYVSPEVTGYEDLDRHGDWYEEAGYGHVWYPRGIAVDWAPYRYGHWAWVFPWGWTWIDDSPWGFAPFHYGRWVHVRRGWCWVPGPRLARPVYAPALVAWVGGNNWRIGVSVGRPVGWFPLGPREVYVPAYRASRTYVTNVNVTNTNVTNVTVINVYDNRVNRTFVNQHIRGAVTAVPEDAFVNSRPVHRAVLNVRDEDMRRGKVVATIPVAPAERSAMGREDTSHRRPPERVVTRTVVFRTAPPRAVPFEAQRRSVADDGTIRPERVKNFPEMRRPQPGENRGRPETLPVRRAESEREEARPDRGRSDKPVGTRPEVGNAPRPESDKEIPRGGRNEVPRPPADRGQLGRRVGPPENRDSRKPEAAREIPRPQPERGTEPAQPRESRTVARPPQGNSDARTSQPGVREVPRPQQSERATEPAQPRESRTVARPPQGNSDARTSQPGVREIPRPQPERAPEPAKPRETRAVARPTPAPAATQPQARPAPQAQEPQHAQQRPEVSRPATQSKPAPAATSSKPQKQEKPAPAKADDKSKKPGDRP